MDSIGRGLRGALGRTLLISKSGHLPEALALLPDTEMIESAHPVPDQASLDAGARLLDWIAEGDADAHYLFLISGGTSSLVEAPREGISLADLQKLNRWLLASGLDIHSMNAIRRRFSRIKG